MEGATSAGSDRALLLSPHPLALESLRRSLQPFDIRFDSVRLPLSAHPDLSQMTAAPGSSA